jgi:hypothetical protein
MFVISTPDPTQLPFGVIVNGVYALASLMLVGFAAKLYWDHYKTWRAVRRRPRPAPQDLELTNHDLEQETARAVKQLLALVMLWAPLFFRPILADGPDRPLFELFRAGIFLMMCGLCFNSYRAITFNQGFRRKWGSRPRPLA